MHVDGADVVAVVAAVVVYYATRHAIRTGNCLTVNGDEHLDVDEAVIVQGTEEAVFAFSSCYMKIIWPFLMHHLNLLSLQCSSSI